MRRWQIVALVAIFLLPFILSLIAGPGMGSLEVAVWLMCLAFIAVLPSAAARVRRRA